MTDRVVDREVLIGIGAYMRQVDLSLHRAFGHPRKVLSDYLREHSALPREVCGHFWGGLRLGPNDRPSGAPGIVRLRFVNLFRRDPVVSGSFFPLANDALLKIADYLDNPAAKVGSESPGLRMPLADLNYELSRTLRGSVVGAYGKVEYFEHDDYRQFETIDKIVGKKWLS
jgi:hypothetical protein